MPSGQIQNQQAGNTTVVYQDNPYQQSNLFTASKSILVVAPWFGFLCCICGLIAGPQGGMYDCKNTCCCLGLTTRCLSCPNEAEIQERVYCVFYETSCNCKEATTCCKSINTFCWLCDHRSAIPCDFEVPCLVTCCGLTLCYKCQFLCTYCSTISTMNKLISEQTAF
jgi:hypothetical protein